jgi:hypothetical protein
MVTRLPLADLMEKGTSISQSLADVIHPGCAAAQKGTAAQPKDSSPFNAVIGTYLGRSILSNTRFAVISATMMLLEIPSRA